MKNNIPKKNLELMLRRREEGMIYFLEGGVGEEMQAGLGSMHLLQQIFIMIKMMERLINSQLISLNVNNYIAEYLN